MVYCSTFTPFYRMRSRERVKYEPVLDRIGTRPMRSLRFSDKKGRILKTRNRNSCVGHIIIVIIIVIIMIIIIYFLFFIFPGPSLIAAFFAEEITLAK